MLGILMFAVALCMLMFGFPVAFTFAGVSLFFGFLLGDIEFFTQVPYRIYSIMQNKELMAVPLFVYMGIMLQKSGLAERLLESMGALFGRVKGGIAISTVLVGALLAATTGVVGASVVAMGVISLPVMLKYKYNKKLATGVICASGTLGQIIPPSIVLIILGDVLQVPVGDLFKAAIYPGLLLVGAYILYVVIFSNYIEKKSDRFEEVPVFKKQGMKELFLSIVPPLFLIIIVLGSIFAAIATPTESASVGCIGAVFLAILYKKFKKSYLIETALETTKITAMVFTILIGASLFSMVFTESGGEHVVKNMMLFIPGGEIGFIIVCMIAIFALGFFIDFIEIAYIVVPMLIPTILHLQINKIWFAIWLAVNLQTSFLTPPFGFSLFYLRGVAPKEVKTIEIYKGVVPFIIIQFFILGLLIIFPDIFIK